METVSATDLAEVEKMIEADCARRANDPDYRERQATYHREWRARKKAEREAAEREADALA